MDVDSTGAASLNGTTGMPQDVDASAISTKKSTALIPASDVVTLEGHEAEVFKCSWNPKASQLATGSGDGTVRIWQVPPGPLSNQTFISDPIVLKHYEDGKEPKDVTSIKWNPAGTLLATGSYEGQVKLWSPTGDLVHNLDAHKGPVFSVKWNPSGSLVASSSVDTSVLVWNSESGSLIRKFEHHTQPALEIDWKDDTTFASCSSDKTIQVCQVSKSTPIKKFEGHRLDVNEIRWCPSGRLLASCSEDSTVKIWSMDSDRYIHDLRGHDKEVFALAWSPTGPGSSNPNENLILASSSVDRTIKLWDPETGKMLEDLSKHKEAVYTLSFSPDGKYLATGGYDCRIIIWNVKDGSVVKHYRGGSGIFEVAWSPRGDKISACFAQNTACIFDFRM